MSEPKRMRLISWRPLIKNSVRGFATVELPIGLKIYDIPILLGTNGPWASLLSKPVLSDGRHVKPKGKGQYAPIIEWRDRDLASRFSDTLISILLEAHPNALDGAP